MELFQQGWKIGERIGSGECLYPLFVFVLCLSFSDFLFSCSNYTLSLSLCCTSLTSLSLALVMLQCRLSSFSIFALIRRIFATIHCLPTCPNLTLRLPLSFSQPLPSATQLSSQFPPQKLISTSNSTPHKNKVKLAKEKKTYEVNLNSLHLQSHPSILLHQVPDPLLSYPSNQLEIPPLTARLTFLLLLEELRSK